MDDLGNAEKQEIGRWANNRVENSHLPFRRRERAMQRFRQMKSLQKFASLHANVHNHFNSERHLIDQETYKARRSGRPGRVADAHGLTFALPCPCSVGQRQVAIRLTAPPRPLRPAAGPRPDLPEQH